MRRLFELANKYRSSALARNTVTYTFNFGLQLVIQFTYFMMISRYLGPVSYGVFVTLSAVSGIANTITGLGSDHVLIQRVAVTPSNFARYFGHALVLLGGTLPLVAAAVMVIGHSITGDHLAFPAFLAIISAHLVCGRLASLCSSIFMAFDRARLQMLVNVGLAVMRASFLLLAILFHDQLTLEIWAWWYLAASAISAVVAIILVLVICGAPRLNIIRADLPLGLQFCLEFMAINSVGDLDKPTVSHFLGPGAAGAYAAGLKIVDAASAPIRALLYATYTRHFRNAAASRADSVGFGVKLLPFSLAMSLAIAVILFVGADYVPYVIGHDFDGTPQIIKLFALYPLLHGISGIGADILRAVGKQHIRILLLVVTALMMVPAIWTGAVLGGLVGAAVARLLLQVGLIAATWLFLLQEKRAVQPAE